MAQDLPNGFTGFSQRRPNGFVSASAAMGTPRYVGAQPPAGNAANKGAYEAATAAFSSGAEGAFQYARDHARPDGEPAQFDPDKLRLIPDVDRRWSWTEIDLNAIRHNTSAVKQRIDNGVRLMAVVKADGYGHGAVRCAKTALNSGADYLGVATVNEAIELREALVNAPILVLSQPPETAIPLLLAYKVMPSVYTSEFAIQYAEAADAFGVRAPYHLAVNTGMNRIGVRHDEVVEFMGQVSFHRALDLVGTFTHFATADSAETLDFQIQVKRFIEAVTALRTAGVNPGIVHAANSAAAIRYPDVQFDMVRLGIAMYGLHPSGVTRPMIDLHPAMSVHARITDVRTVPMSEGVSYGMNYRSPGSVKICTVPVGYADGLRRGLSGRTDVILKGQRCHQVGNICMDQCMFEVDLRVYGSRRRLDPMIGDEVLLVGREGDSVITLDDMANTLGTINYELRVQLAHAARVRVGKGIRMTKPHIPLDEIRAQVEGCRKCPLADGRTQTVFGVGNPEARVMIIGEAPGKNEDLQGEPFVGAAGKYLNELLAVAGLVREDVFIANVLKCRPPGNRDPRPEEIELCTPYLREQTRTIDPEFLVTLGNFSTKFILKTDIGITRLHGTVQRAGKFKVFPIFHPAAALYDGSKREALENDFATLGELLRASEAERAAEAAAKAAEPPHVEQPPLL